MVHTEKIADTVNGVIQWVTIQDLYQKIVAGNHWISSLRFIRTDETGRWSDIL